MKKTFILVLFSFLLVGCAHPYESYKGHLFQSDLLAVSKDEETWGYVNAAGETVIDFQYEKAASFYNGQAIVVVDGNYQVIDTKGHNILEKPYEYLYRDEYSGLLLYLENQLWGLINDKGKVILEPTYSSLEPFQEGMAKVFNHDLYGYINEQGEVVIDLKYREGRRFINGYAVVQDSQNRYGLIDKKGNTIINFMYNDISDVDSKGNIIVRIGSDETSSYDLINVDHQEVILDDYKSIYTNSSLKSGTLYGVVKDEYKEIYDYEGNRFTTDDYIYLVIHGDYLVSYQKKDALLSEPNQELQECVLFNEDGSIIISAPRQDSQTLVYEKNGEYTFLLAKRDEEDLVIYGLDQTYQIEAAQIRDITDQLFITYKEGYYGAYDRNENLVLQYEFHFLKQFKDGFIMFKKGALYGFMNDEYEVLVDLTYKQYNLNINVLYV